MFFIPGSVVAALTFPGVILHEIAHRLFCDLAKVPVYEVRYFRLGTPAGYVIHGQPPNLKASFLISIGPLLVNTAACALFSFAGVMGEILLDGQSSAIHRLLLWVGFSAGMHAFPSGEDMTAFRESVKRAHESGPLLWFARIAAMLVVVANALRVIWFDLFFAAAVATALPLLLVAVIKAFIG